MIAIIISDFRPHVLAAAFTIRDHHKNNKRVECLTSDRFWNLSEYGNDRLGVSQQGRARRLLEAENVAYVEGNLINSDPEDFTGIYSSLYSITNDSMASKDRYYELWDKLSELDAGAKDIVKYLVNAVPEEVYIFNGRLASVYPIAAHFKKTNTKVAYYEYGFRANECFTLTNFPIHDLRRWGESYLDYYNSRSVLGKKRNERRERSYIKNKFSNRFTVNYLEDSSVSYDMSVFLSSTHEFKSLAVDVGAGFYQRGEVQFVIDAMKENPRARKIAVKCHPNQLTDVSWRESLEPLMSFCKENDIDLFLPDSRISSYSLLHGSDLIVVDISSIGIESIILGRKTQIYGNPSYKPVYEDALRRHGDDLEAARKYFISVMSVSSHSNQMNYSRKWRAYLFYANFIRIIGDMRRRFAGFLSGHILSSD